jgi:hypothetical protein
MEQFMGNVFWAPSSRTYAQDATEFAQLGINVVRLPLVTQTLRNSPCDAQGVDPVLKNNQTVRIQCARTALETVIRTLNDAGIMVLLDIHSCSNFVDWRKGRLDARPPWVDATRENYDFKREDTSCAATGNPPGVTRIQAYNETMWLNDLRTLAGLGPALGVSNIMGIDIFNEPHDYTWAEWRTLAGNAYNAINEVNPNILIFVEGIGTTPGMQDGTPTTFTQEPHGNTNTNPNWGENLFSAGANPPAIPQNRLVFSPHTYGPSVFVQRMFLDPAQTQCANLEGDAAAAAQCQIVINPTLLAQGWDEHFGYLKAMGYAVVIGEFGGNMQWPGGKASLRDQQMWGYLTNRSSDQQWQNAFVDYLISRNIRDSIYWSINPESGDTGGLYTTPYQPGSNESGWGTWGAVDQTKLAMLQRLWGPIGPNPTATRTPTRTSTVIGATATRTATRTNTPVIGATATRTATRTNTPVIGATATRTSTRTNTPIGATATRTSTRTNTPIGATATRTNTPVVGASCTVTYTVNDWNNGGGFTGNVTIRNNSATAINGWTLVWTYANQRFDHGWNATISQPGGAGTQVTAVNLSYNNIIGANGGTQSFGFNATWFGSNPRPTSFTLNGTACTVQ